MGSSMKTMVVATMSLMLGLQAQASTEKSTKAAKTATASKASVNSEKTETSRGSGSNLENKVSATETTENQEMGNPATAPVVGDNRIELPDVEPQEKKNEEITNQRLAADMGAPTKWSMRAILSYSGGSLEDPFGRVRPNYRKLPGSPILDTMLGGSVGVAYRVDAKSQLRLTTGVSMRTPLHNTADELGDNVRKDGRRIFNVSGLSGEYNRTFRSGSVMLSPSVGMSMATDEFIVNTVGLVGSVSGSLTSIFEIDGSRWQPGATVSVYQSFYRDNNVFDGRGGRRENYGVGLFPFVEYQFNDRYAFRTVFGFFNYTNYRDQGPTEFYRDGNYISSGIGITPKKGIWVYPNIQFNPDDTRAELTNVGVSTILNIF